MINYNEKERAFKLDTEKTSYLIRIYPSGHLGHLYYGKRLESVKSLADLELKFGIEVGNQFSMTRLIGRSTSTLRFLKCPPSAKATIVNRCFIFVFKTGRG